MQFRALSTQAFHAYLAGLSRGLAREYIAKARANADYPEARVFTLRLPRLNGTRARDICV